jgi:transposase
VLAFFAAQPACLVAMEACPGADHWGREIAKLGYTVKLIAPTYVKPFVKRQKNDATDAEAICEAAQRPTMRFVAVESEAKQASAVIFRTRNVLVGQRTQLINAIRGHLAEYGQIAPKAPIHVERLIALIEDPASDILLDWHLVLRMVRTTMPRASTRSCVHYGQELFRIGRGRLDRR